MNEAKASRTSSAPRAAFAPVPSISDWAACCAVPADPPNLIQIILTSAGHPLTPDFSCYTDSPVTADPGQSDVRYNCIVYPNSDAPPIWSGYVDLSGLSFTGANAVKVCRYRADYDGDRIIGNAEHALQCTALSGSLRKQNFLVIKAGQACPVGHGVDASMGYFNNAVTVLHPDASTPSHAGS